jgi:hypothetical protein
MATATELPFLAGTNPRSASSTDWPSMGKSAFGLVSEAQKILRGISHFAAEHTPEHVTELLLAHLARYRP